MLHAAVLSQLREMQSNQRFSPNIPSVFAAHAFVQGAVLPHRFRMTDMEDVLFHVGEIPSDSAYVALGHLHRPQCVGDNLGMRYSGSIERLDMGEREDSKQVVVVELGRRGPVREPDSLPLAATPFYDIRITNPREELPRLRARYPEAARALVRYHVTFTPGRDNLNEILAEMNRIFPRWYERSWMRAGSDGLLRQGKGSETEPESQPDGFIPPASFHDTVMQFLSLELEGHAHRDAVLKLAEQILAEEVG
jgi:DNA repair exonuclease SbcCD nuclease subunit